MKKIIAGLVLALFLSLPVFAGGGAEAFDELTEDEIKTLVEEELEWDFRIDASRLDVEVDEHTVNVSGYVPTKFQHNAALAAIWNLQGIEEINYNVEVKPKEEYPTDEAIRNNVARAIVLNTNIPRSEFNVFSTNGTVKIEGEAKTLVQKRAAGRIAEQVAGVVDVINNIVVLPEESIRDKAIADNLINALDRNRNVESDRVDVKVQNGTAVLTGVVEDRQAFLAAEELASITVGVKEVRNELEIAAEPSGVQDNTIQTEIRDQLLWDTRVTEENINVSVKNGDVVLSGTADAFIEKTAAEEDAWSIAGVKTVENNIEIVYEKKTLNRSLLQSNIEETILSIAVTEAEDIEVTVEEGGQVELEGTVDAYWKRPYIASIAEDVLGVTDVYNQITVVPEGTISDEQIAEEIISSLERKSSVESEDITVVVEDGKATLSGVVPTWISLRNVFETAQNTAGVREIETNITVQEQYK